MVSVFIKDYRRNYKNKVESVQLGHLLKLYIFEAACLPPYVALCVCMLVQEMTTFNKFSVQLQKQAGAELCRAKLSTNLVS